MWLVRRVLSLNWLYAVLAQLYPPLRTVPLSALVAVAGLVGLFWALSHYALGHAPASLSIKTLPAVLIRKPKPGPARIPQFVLLEQDGSVRDVLTTLGPRKTVMYLYSPSCGHCAKMLPRFAEFTRRLDPERVTVVGVQFYGSLQLLNTAGIAPGRLLADRQGEFCGLVGVGEFTVFVLDREGNILHRSSGDNLDALY